MPSTLTDELLMLDPKSDTVQVVIQATPFCNLDCTYCYLPDRSDNRLMPMAVVTAFFSFLRDASLVVGELDVRWHAGEPLAAGIDFYTKAFDSIARTVGDSFTTRYSLQTNGTLVDPHWCDLFVEHDLKVGVSIDGPASIHDSHRIRRNGKGTFEACMRGIACLNSRHIPYDSISVITSSTLKQSNQFFDFFANLKPRSIGLNVEETEGNHISNALSSVAFAQEFREFLRKLTTWEKITGIPVREFSRLRDFIFGNQDMYHNSQNMPLAILTVDALGNVYTFSPELAGLHHVKYPTFAIGNVMRDSWEDILRSPALGQLSLDIRKGVALCHEECSYFNMCGGGAPVNKLYENGGFDTSETKMCRNSLKAVADVVVSNLECSADI